MNGFDALLHHALVVGVKRHVGVHVAVTGVHVQRNEHASAQYAGVNGVNFGAYFFKGVAWEDLKEFGAHLFFPGHAYRAVVNEVKDRLAAVFAQHGGRQREPQSGKLFGLFANLVVEVMAQVKPACADGLHQFERLRNGGFQQKFLRNARRQRRFTERNVAVQVVFERIEHFKLVVDRALDVERFAAERVFADLVERNHHVFVELEGVGVCADGRRLAAFVPEGKARFGCFGDKTFAVDFGAKVDYAADGFFESGFVAADDVAHNHHLGIVSALTLDRIVNRFQIAVVKVFEAGEHTTFVAVAEQVGNFQNCFARKRGSAEKFQADRVSQGRHLVQNPARRSNDAVGAFLLNRRQPAKELVGDILAETFAAVDAAGGDKIASA